MEQRKPSVIKKQFIGEHTKAIGTQNMATEAQKEDVDAQPPRQTPEDLIASASSVETLTVSDQHATLLLTHQLQKPPAQQSNENGVGKGDDGADTGKESVGESGAAETRANGKTKDNAASATTATIMKKSILKVTLVPFHREAFGAGKRANDLASSEKETKGVPSSPSNHEGTQDIQRFLSDYRFSMTSESGAEYSYYDARPNDVVGMAHTSSTGGLFQMVSALGKRARSIFEGSNTSEQLNTRVDKCSTPPGSFKVEVISPASERQVSRAMPSPACTLVEETPDMYERITQPHIQSIVDGKSLGWLFALVDKKKETERLLLDDDDFILNIDTKWRSHPDIANTKREEWHNHASVSDLYCLAILKERGVATLRDLRARHLPALRRMADDGKRTIESVYGVPPDQLRVFVHYHPQFYHFHVHFTRLENEGGCQVERGHLISDIIQNLEGDSDFYSKRTLTYKIPVNNALCVAIMADREEKK